MVLDLIPVFSEIVVPRLKRLFVVGSEIMPIFHDKPFFDRFSDLFDRGDHAVGKDIL